MPAADTIARTIPTARADVAVHGAGAVGMAAALALARIGLGVNWHGDAPHPTRPDGAADVRAYAVNAAAVALLAELKVWDAIPADARTPVHEMQVRGDEAAARLAFSAYQTAVTELAWIVDAAELESALRAALRFAAGVRAMPRVAPGSAPGAALEVLADGREGSLRSERGVGWQRHAYGQTAIAARLTTAIAHGNVARQWFRHPDVLALLPLDRPRHGASVALVWSLPAERATALLRLDDAAFEAELGTALGGSGAPDLAPRLAGPRQAWPLQIASASAVHGPGWVLVGDAAHVVHPLAGQGLNLGLADVAALVAVLAAREPWRAPGDEWLLARYARARALPTRAMQFATDGLLELFARDEPWARWLRNRGMNLVDRLPPLKRALAAQAFGR